ncbi:hypothetical protein HYX12_02945, partial [Candidatus Woesearchaeota archaeon]|nr:hypothetical protein [Candidatus Woesearchaeota archaeon]
GPLTYPGALFPNNFTELEQYGKGGYYIVETEQKDGEHDTIDIGQDMINGEQNDKHDDSKKKIE